MWEPAAVTLPARSRQAEAESASSHGDTAGSQVGHSCSLLCKHTANGQNPWQRTTLVMLECCLQELSDDEAPEAPEDTRQSTFPAAPIRSRCKLVTLFTRQAHMTDCIADLNESGSRSPLEEGLGSFARREKFSGDRPVHPGARSYSGRHQMGSVRSTQPLLTAFMAPQRGKSSKAQIFACQFLILPCPSMACMFKMT